MRAAILSIGDELLNGAAEDTNAPWLAAQLASRAVTIIERRTLGDDLARIAAALRELTDHADLIICTGGLGPTDDDLTRDALAAAATPGRPLVLDAGALTRLERRYAASKRIMPEANRRQATRPETAAMLDNPNGTAPGLHVKVESTVSGHSCLIFTLPGPPYEMKPMFERFVLPELPTGEATDIASVCLVHAYGLSESEAAERLGDLLARGHNPLAGITVSGGTLTARIRGIGRAAVITDEVAQVAAEVELKWAPHVYGRDDQSLGESVNAMLRDRAQTLATAESCTGGWLGRMIVDPAGCSDVYRGGWITYSNEMKQHELGVPRELLEAHGAVSAPVALAMAEGARQRSGADIALSITGVAGPDGGSDDKPVGTVFIGLSSARVGGEGGEVRHFRFRGDRMMVRERSARSALQMLRFHLQGVSDQSPLLWQVMEPVGGPLDG